MPDLTSGAIGLVLGGMIGLILSVLFEDKLKAISRRVGFRVRNLVARGALPEERRNFALGPLQTDLFVIEGDGEQVIDEQSVDVIIDPTEVEMPPEVAEWKEEVHQREHQKRARGEDFLWNGLNYAVAGFSCSRVGIDETPAIALTFQSADHFTFAASQQLDRVMSDGTTLRKRYLANDDVLSVPAFISSSFGMNIAVVTADNLVMFSKRSGHVGTQPHTWNSSANEALSRSLDSQGRSAPDLYDVARRGLEEELALDRSEYRLEMLGVSIDRGRHQWGCLFVAFLKELRGDAFLERLSRGVPDRFEHENHQLARFTIPDVVEYLLCDERRDYWSPTAPALFYFALIRKYGRRQVEAEAARVIRRMFDTRPSVRSRIRVVVSYLLWWRRQ